MVASLLPPLPERADDEEEILFLSPKRPAPAPGMLGVYRVVPHPEFADVLCVSFIDYVERVHDGLALARRSGPGKYHITTTAGVEKAVVTI